MLNTSSWEWNEQTIDDFLSLRFSEDETRSLLASLTPDRITLGIFQAFVNGMQAKALAIPRVDVKTLDCCGTGGSGIPRFNTSTTAAFIMAAGGVPVVKFGNRAASSKSGSFDLLELLGIPATWPLEALPELLETCGLVFLYAPQVYSELSGFMTLRRALGVPTIFNSMGPLLNPLQPAYRLLGASSPIMQKMLADFLSHDRHTEHAWVLRASSGLDELVSDELNCVYTVTQHSQKMIDLNFSSNKDLLLKAPSNSHTPEENHLIFKELVSSEDNVSPHYENVCLNAGAGLYVSGKAASLEAGIQQAKQLMVDGSVQNTYNKVRKAYENLSR